MMNLCVQPLFNFASHNWLGLGQRPSQVIRQPASHLAAAFWLPHPVICLAGWLADPKVQKGFNLLGPRFCVFSTFFTFVMRDSVTFCKKNVRFALANTCSRTNMYFMQFFFYFCRYLGKKRFIQTAQHL